jgi:hypothetical protein
MIRWRAFWSAHRLIIGPFQRVDFNLDLGDATELQIQIATVLFDGCFQCPHARGEGTLDGWPAASAPRRWPLRHGHIL